MLPRSWSLSKNVCKSYFKLSCLSESVVFVRFTVSQRRFSALSRSSHCSGVNFLKNDKFDFVVFSRYLSSGNKPTDPGDAASSNEQTSPPKEEVKQIELQVKNKKILVTASFDSDSKATNVTIQKVGKTDDDKKVSGTAKKRIRIDYSASFTERNFITPVRAMSEYLLKPSDLETLPKTKRRSPYELEPPITVYWRRDVEAKALEVWGSKENLKKELLKREIEHKTHQQNVFTVKRRLREYRREMGNTMDTLDSGLHSASGRVVLTAVTINGLNFLFKLLAWFYTGSHSMFAECIHSLADTINQLILTYGIHKSIQTADTSHPYGYTNMGYVTSLISGVCIFCVGSGLSFYHGFMGIMHPQPLEDFYWAYFILGGAVVSEGATLVVALNALKKGAMKRNLSLTEYVMRGSDPSVSVVVLEDAAAVAGVLAAGGCMALSAHSGSPLPDAIGSLLVGSLLGIVASFIIYTNVGALTGRSIPQGKLDEINSELETDVMIRAIHDVKGIDMGNNLIRYKAELDFDGRELTRSYLDKQDLTTLLDDIKKLNTKDELESFLLKHGENIVDMLGGEIDRIELKIRKKFPDVRHCDLEIL